MTMRVERTRVLKFVDGKFIVKFDPDQPRDERGRFGSGDVASAGPSEAQYAALDNYVGDGYYSINNYLRTNTVEGFDRLAIANRVSILDSLMSPAETDKTIYRGVYPGELAEKLKDLEPGDRFSDKGFISTSESKSFAEQWSTSSVSGAGVLMTIDAPAGTMNIKIDDVVSGVNSEQEVILARETTFEVMSNENGKMELQVVN